MNSGLEWDEIEVGASTDVISLPITYGMVAGVIYATRDWFPGHHNPAYAREQGKPDIYLNTVFLQGFIDRVALEWAGCGWFVQRRQMRMRESVYSGDVLNGTGTVRSKHRSDAGVGTVDVVIEGRKGVTLALAGEITLALPARGPGSVSHGLWPAGQAIPEED